jgi:phage gp29-like protein
MALWGLFGEGKKAPPKIAGLISPVQNLFRLYPEDSVTPQRYKLIQKNADIGWTAELMELMDAASADYKIASVLRTRKLSVAAADWDVEPYDDSDQAKMVADETKDFLSAIPNFTQLKMDLLDAHYRGFAAGRAKRAMVDNDPKFPGMTREMVVEWEPIESRFFYFFESYEPRVMTYEVPHGIPLPKEFLFHVVRDKPGPITRGGTGRGIVKMWLYKGYFTVDMASYLEKFGQPHVQVTIPGHYVEGSDELERAKAAARSLIADHIGLVPEGVAIELLETIKQTSTVKDTYIAAIQFCDEAIAMAETGHTLTSAGSTVGGLGHGQEAKQAADVKQEIKEYDAMGLEETINDQLIRPRHLRQYGDKVPAPRFCIDVKEPEDELQISNAQYFRAQSLEILQGMGLKLSTSEMYEEFDLEEPEDEDDTLEAPQPDPPAPTDAMPGQPKAPATPKPKAKPKKKR